MGNRPPAQWASPTIGTLLRLAFGPENFRLQFVSVAFGLVWFAWYRWQKRAEWNWGEQLPLVLLVSFVTAPYGAWPFDMVLLLPAVFVLVRSSRAFAASVILINLGCLLMNLFETGSFWFVWGSPAWLLVYAVHMRSPRELKADCPRSNKLVPA